MRLSRRSSQRGAGRALSDLRNVAKLHVIVSEMWYNVGVPNMCMLDEIRTKQDEIYAIAKRHKAEKLCGFGFYARKGERSDGEAILALPEAGSFEVIFVEIPTSAERRCKTSAKAMIGFGKRFHVPRPTDEWMKELREGED